MATTFTAGQLLTRANKLMGVIAGNESMPADIAADSLVVLNGLLDSFTTQPLMLPATTREVFNYTVGVNTYLIGPSQTWNTARPSAIEFAAVLSSTATPSFEIAQGILDDQSYQAISIKDLEMTFPVQVYYNPTNLVSGQIFVWGTPTDTSNYQQVLYLAQQLTQFADLTTSVTMASGYYRMLYYNVAVELGMAFQVPFRADVAKFAESSLKDAKRLNLQAMDLQTDLSLPGGSGIYNSYSDTNYH